MPTTRIYVVMQTDKPHRLVEATSASQAIRHCTRPEYSARVASPKDVANLLMPGSSIERALDIDPDSKQDQQATNN